MAASSAGTHEPYEKLSPDTLDKHRALASLMEELEAIDWYRQRMDVCGDEQLKAILEHNMNEESNMPPWCSNGSVVVCRK